MNNTQNKNEENAGTQALMPINEIRNNVVLLKNGGLRSIIEIDGMNIDLLSNEEENNILSGWQNFLNNLDFSVQTLIVSRKTNIEEYINNVNETTKDIDNELLKSQANDYVQFIQDFINNNPIMDKRYYIVVPYDPVIFKASNILNQMQEMFSSIFNLNREAFKQNLFLNEEEFQKNYEQLILRQDTIISNAKRIGLTAKLLATNELISLIHNIYNPDSPMDIKNNNNF